MNKNHLYWIIPLSLIIGSILTYTIIPNKIVQDDTCATKYFQIYSCKDTYSGYLENSTDKSLNTFLNNCEEVYFDTLNLSLRGSD